MKILNESDDVLLLHTIDYKINKPKPKKKYDEGGYVYFIMAVGTDRVKIGYTKNFDQRLDAMKTDCPVQLVPLLLLRFGHKGYESMYYERHLHKLFKDSRASREWFDMTDEVMNYIENVVENGEEWAKKYIDDKLDIIDEP